LNEYINAYLNQDTYQFECGLHISAVTDQHLHQLYFSPGHDYYMLKRECGFQNKLLTNSSFCGQQ